MDSPEIPDDLREFLLVNIASYEQLETLLVLRAHSEREWTAALVAKTLNVSLTATTEALEHLRKRNLLVVRVEVSERHFRYSPGTPAQAHCINMLAQAYDKNRLAIMNLMSSNAIDRVRARTARMFADAFILRGKKNNDG